MDFIQETICQDHCALNFWYLALLKGAHAGSFTLPVAVPKI
jgi:hypothetical protein